MTVNQPTTPEQMIRRVVGYLLSAKASENDAVWLMEILSDDLRPFLRAEVLSALDEKSTRAGKVDPVKRRKIFYALAGIAKAIFGSDYEKVKSNLDQASKAAARTGQ